MSGRGSKRVIASVGTQQSGKHSMGLHNKLVQLSKKPLSHKESRKEIEASILHLVRVHKVVVTENLKTLLIEKANPSEELLLALFPEDFAEKSQAVIHAGIMESASEMLGSAVFA